MFEKESKTDIGMVQIKDEVLSSIAMIAAKEVDGVAGTYETFLDACIHLFFRHWPEKGIKVEIRDNDVKISLAVIVRYGVDIPRIANAIQENVRASIERMTGIGSVEVDVSVQKVVQ